MSFSLKAYLLSCAAATAIAIPVVAVVAPESGPTPEQIAEQRNAQ